MKIMNRYLRLLAMVTFLAMLVITVNINTQGQLFENNLKCRELYEKTIDDYVDDLNELISLRSLVASALNALDKERATEDEPSCILLPPTHSEVVYDKKENVCLIYVSKTCHFNKDPKIIDYGRIVNITNNQVIISKTVNNILSDLEFMSIYDKYFNR